jgi:hypothetical protein
MRRITRNAGNNIAMIHNGIIDHMGITDYLCANGPLQKEIECTGKQVIPPVQVSSL